MAARPASPGALPVSGARVPPTAGSCLRTAAPPPAPRAPGLVLSWARFRPPGTGCRPRPVALPVAGRGGPAIGRPGPAVAIPVSLRPRGPPEPATMPLGLKPTCSVCKTTSSSMWKKSPQGDILCLHCSGRGGAGGGGAGPGAAGGTGGSGGGGAGLGAATFASTSAAPSQSNGGGGGKQVSSPGPSRGRRRRLRGAGGAGPRDPGVRRVQLGRAGRHPHP